MYLMSNLNPLPKLLNTSVLVIITEYILKETLLFSRLLSQYFGLEF